MIQGVKRKKLTQNVDERGSLTEIFRSDWDIYDPEPSMAYYSESYPGIIRAWHRHLHDQVDYFTCISGNIKIGIYDERSDSPTQGELNTFIIGDGNRQLIRIPGDCWHGFKVIGDRKATLLNSPSRLYEYEDPDEERLPHDTSRIPLDWDAEPHK